MSIIYGTLERLEADNQPRAYNNDQASSSRLIVESRGLSVKTVVTALTVVVAATSLMLGLSNDKVVGPQNVEPLRAVTPNVLAENPDYELSPVPYEEQTTVPIEATEPNRQTAMEHVVESATPTSIVLVPAKGKQRSGSEAEPVIAVDVKTDTGSTRVAKSGTASAEPDEQKQTPSNDSVRPDGLEELIEQAQYALSKGQYEHALSTLETLKPVPEKRADFWFIKGSAHLGFGQLDLAEVAFASAQALVPDNAQIAVQQAILKQEKGDHAGALQILKGAAIRHPTVPEILLNQGYSQQTLGATLDAKRSFRAFLNMTEGRSVYFQQRAVVKKWLAQDRQEML